MKYKVFWYSYMDPKKALGAKTDAKGHVTHDKMAFPKVISSDMQSCLLCCMFNATKYSECMVYFGLLVQGFLSDTLNARKALGTCLQQATLCSVEIAHSE